MKLRFLTTLVFLVPALVPGQDKGTFLFPGPNYVEIKQYLGLTDAQIQSLQTIVDSRNQAIWNIYTQISQKNDALYQLLNSDNGTAAQLGQFLIDVRNLQKQLPLNDGPYKTQSLNVLTADQKAKLPKLSDALRLQPAFSQAGMLLLIDYPGYTGLPGITPLSCAAAAGASANDVPVTIPPQSHMLPSINR